jgi:hypothetical protein
MRLPWYRSSELWQAAQVIPANSPVAAPFHAGFEITVLLMPIGNPSGLLTGFGACGIRP